MNTKPPLKWFAAGLVTLLALPARLPSQTTATAPAALPAFPGAEGFGAAAPGGRGGSVYEVTNLNDSGPGSLRDAVSRSDRIVVFRVSGTITLQKKLDVSGSRLTIAGQTAPGDGICLRNYSLGIKGQDVVVRYLRVRLGDRSGQESDAITVEHGARNVVLDHCSATWSVDEALSLAGDVSDVTVQWCLIAEALRQSKHAKGAHGYGSLARANGRVSLHHNLWAHNDARNPRLGDNYGKAPYPTFDVRNNVMYDYGALCSGITQGVLKVNYVGNYIKPGPSSKARHPIRVGAPSDLRFFIRDNVFEGDEAQTAENTCFFDPVEIDGKRQVQTVGEPFPAAPVRTLPAREAYEAVLAGVGASLPARDSVDARIVRQARERTGKMIDSQEQVGGWPELRSALPPRDSDHDGMPDDWEVRSGFDPNNAADGRADKDGDGYTNVEEWLNGTDPNRYVDYRQPGNNVNSLPVLAPVPASEAPTSQTPPAEVTVAAAGKADYRTVQAAIDAAPRDKTRAFVIRVKPGLYKEKITVPLDKGPIRLVGEDAATTVLTFDDHARTLGTDGKEIGTSRSASVTVLADDFSAENVTFANSAGPVAQAVALNVWSDRAVFRRCRFLGWQDTLLVNRNRQYFEDCYIEGHVDFIFGASSAWFERCHLHCRGTGYITAASTPETQPFGFVFSRCWITAEPGARVYLGRPWRPYGSVVFLDTTMPAEILPAGWDNWRNPANETTARYAEYRSAGPGASPQRARWSRQLTDAEAAEITAEAALGGWDPKLSSSAAAPATAAERASAPAEPSPAEERKVRIVLVGDSTVAPSGGWGPGFAKLVGPDAECINRAVGGRSSRSYIDEGRWQKALELKPDYVLIQFGHNDQPGKGPERETDPATTYTQFMARYVDESRAIGAIPILVTSLTRRHFTPEGKIRTDLTPYVEAVRKLAAEKKVPLVDLHARSIEQMEKIGPEAAVEYDLASPDPAKPDRTHLSEKGSDATALLVADELRRVAPDLARHLIPPAK